MKRSGPPRRSKGLTASSSSRLARTGRPAPRSRKRIDADRRDADARRSFLLANPWCVAKLDGCQTVATDRHHLHTRNTRPDLVADPAYWLALCRPCHAWVTVNPDAARSLGLARKSWETPGLDEGRTD